MIYLILPQAQVVPSDYEYGTLANYSPRGISELSVRSRRTCGAIKAGRIDVLENAITHLKSESASVLQRFLNTETTLVPVPRSSPLPEGALWPSRAICEVLALHGFGREVELLLARTHAVRKSSASPAAERPLWHEHFESISVSATLLRPARITLIDDVLTMGRTSYACAERLKEAFPETEIRTFAMIRTQGFLPEIERILDPSTGIVSGYASGKTHRDP